MDQRTQWNIYFIFQISPICHRMCIPLFLHPLVFYCPVTLLSLLGCLVCSGGCKITFWQKFPVSNFCPASPGPPLSAPHYPFVRCGTTPPHLPHRWAHPSAHMCKWCLDGQNEHALVLELWSLLHVRPYSEIMPDQHGCWNAKGSSRFLQWLDDSE